MDESACVGDNLLGNREGQTSASNATNGLLSEQSSSLNVYHQRRHTTRESDESTHNRVWCIKYRDAIQRWADFVFVMFVIGPLVVAYWRGTWSLVNIYLFPNNLTLSAWMSFAVGTSVVVMLNFSQGILEKWHREKNFAAFHALFRVYVYIFGFSVVNHWRGFWYILDVYTNVTVLSATVSIAIATPVLLALRAFGNLVAAPGAILVDICDTPFRLSTRFAADVSLSCTFAGDVVLTVIFVGSLVVAAWRGTWTLFDTVVFPDDQKRSAWASVGVGYGTLFLLSLLEIPVSRLLSRTKRLSTRIVLEDVFKLAVWVGVLSVWRGLWLVCDNYVLSDDPVTSYWVTHGVGIGGLFLIVAGRSVLVAGCVVDGEAVDGSGVRLGRYLEQIRSKPVHMSTEQASDGRNHGDLRSRTTPEEYETSL